MQVSKITNANVYINGANLFGMVKEFEAPKIVQKMTEHEALGMLGTIELPSGIEKMEAKAVWASVYPDALEVVANPFAALNIQVRGSLERYTSNGRAQEVPVVIFMTATCQDLPMGDYKRHEPVELESNFNVTAARLEVDGVAIVEFDAFANIYKVNGLDVAVNYKANTGT